MINCCGNSSAAGAGDACCGQLAGWMDASRAAGAGAYLCGSPARLRCDGRFGARARPGPGDEPRRRPRISAAALLRANHARARPAPPPPLAHSLRRPRAVRMGNRPQSARPPVHGVQAGHVSTRAACMRRHLLRRQSNSSNPLGLRQQSVAGCVSWNPCDRAASPPPAKLDLL